MAKKYDLTLADVALRWLSHHSQMKREYDDAVLIGASSVKHVEENLAGLEKGPLRESSPQLPSIYEYLIDPLGDCSGGGQGT